MYHVTVDPPPNGSSSSDVLEQLQKTVESLRTKSRNIMRRHSELHSCIQKFTSPDHPHRRETAIPSSSSSSSSSNKTKASLTSSNGGQRKDSFEPTLHYAQLSSEDKQTMKDILMLQEWLLMIKREKTFEKFRHTITDLKDRIFKPAQSTQMRTRVASSQAPGPPSLGFDTLEADELDTEEVNAKAEQVMQKQEDQADSNDPKIPDGVLFQNGRWIQVDGATDDTFDELDAISDDGFGEDDVANHAGDHDDDDDGDGLDDIVEEEDMEFSPHVGGDANALDGIDLPDDFQQVEATPVGSKTQTRKRGQAFSSNTLPNPRTRAKSSPVHAMSSTASGPSKRILHEFKLSNKIKSSWTASAQRHAEEYSVTARNPSTLLATREDSDLYAWLHHQADMFTTFDTLFTSRQQNGQ